MSQTTVTRHYNIRKRNVNHAGDSKLQQPIFPKENAPVVEKVVQNVKATSIPKTGKDLAHSQETEIPKAVSKKKRAAPAKKDKKPPPVDKKSKSRQSTLTNFFTSESDKLKLGESKADKAKNCFSSCVGQQRDSSDPETTIPKRVAESEIRFLPQSPKRNLPNPSEEGTPSKKKHLEEIVTLEEESKVLERPSKPKETARRKLQLDSLSGKSNNVVCSPNSKLASASPKKNLLRTPDKLDALIDQSRSKLILSPKLDELKKSLILFSQTTSRLKELQSNPYRSNVIASSSKSPVKKLALPQVFACERFSHLSAADSSLVLPLKYKVLSEMFRSMDTLVATMNNRKEKITFDNLKEGVQKIMKRNFSEKHLGQIVTILPSAYELSREKVSYISKKIGCPEYQLVIMPKLTADEDSNKKTAAFQPMNPSCLILRMNEFNRNLLDLVKRHHQDFLTKIRFVNVSKDSIQRWHPKFLVDSVPDVPVAPLPESPEMKVYTAKDVLNRFKGSIRSKVGKALQSVADETEKSGVTLDLKEIANPKPETSKTELKGICSDLLEKIRAKESAKLLKTMTQSPEETKKLAMMERVPKIVNILFTYFIAERKAAIPLDTVVEKIIHSFNSLSTPDVVKEHLKLITEKFPGWLNFIQIPKGVYITLNKKTNINEMLNKAGLH